MNGTVLYTVHWPNQNSDIGTMHCVRSICDWLGVHADILKYVWDSVEYVWDSVECWRELCPSYVPEKYPPTLIKTKLTKNCFIEYLLMDDDDQIQ